MHKVIDVPAERSSNECFANYGGVACPNPPVWKLVGPVKSYEVCQSCKDKAEAQDKYTEDQGYTWQPLK